MSVNVVLSITFHPLMYLKNLNDLLIFLSDLYTLCYSSLHFLYITTLGQMRTLIYY
jgi:hypothetical protein